MLDSPTTPGRKAVFLSYASQDAVAAKRICEALRAVGVEVWFDQNELVGGDAWDAKIRKQITECALFLPIISASTQARLEGYFRIEWKLAARRTHAMATVKAFLFPVVIDDTRDADAHVPDEFREVQWTRLPGGEAPEKFCARVKTLLDGTDRVRPGEPAPGAASAGPQSAPPARRVPTGIWVAAAAVGAGLVGLALWWQRPAAPQSGEAKAGLPAAPATVAASPADALVAKARALLEDDPLRTRRNLELAEQFCLQAIGLEPTNGEALAVAAWVNFLFLDDNYDNTPQRRADLRRYAESAALLSPGSVYTGLAQSGVLIETGNRPEAVKQLTALAQRYPDHLSVLRQLASAAWRSEASWENSEAGARPILDRLRAHSPVGRSYADALLAAKYWVRGDYVEADRLLDGIFASGHPVRTSYLCRLLILAYGWGDLEQAKAFIATIPEKLLLEDVFIFHVATVWTRLGEYDRALATLNRTQRELLHESRIEQPTAQLRGNILAAAGRPNAAVIEWRTALQVVEQQLRTNPRNLAILAHKIELLGRLGDRAAAAEQFTLFSELVHPAEGSIPWAETYAYFVQVGDLDAAVARLDRLIARDYGRWPGIYHEVRFDPEFAKFRQDPRVAPILARAAGWLQEKRAAKSASPAPATSAVLDAKSVAVLAFKNLSGDPAREFFSDGLSEAVADVLGRVPGLKVVGSASAFSFKGKAVPIPEIARQLGVTHLVEGAVLQEGQTVRITAKLIQADGFQVWVSDKLDRELKNIFALHDEVAGLIAKNLSLKLGAGSAAATTIVNPQTYELYVQGRKAWALRGEANFARAEEAFNRALAIDPAFAPARVGLIDVRLIRGQNTFALGRFDDRDHPDLVRASAELQEVIKAAPDLAEAHSALGITHFLRWNLPAAQQEFEAAIRLNPNYATAHQWLGRVHESEGRPEEAVRFLQRAVELEPLFPVLHDNLSARLALAGRFEAALAAANRAIELSMLSSAPYGYSWKGYILNALGRREEGAVAARELIERGRRELAPASRGNFINLGIAALARAGAKAEAEKFLTPDLVGSLHYSYALAALGRLEESVAALQLGNMTRFHVTNLFYQPEFDPVRSDPRFLKMLADAGATEAHARAQAWRKAHPPEKPGSK